MTRLVICRKLGKQLPGLESPPMPGPVGEAIYEHVSAEAWEQWQALQTMLINEKHLNMMDPEHRAFLEEQMVGFLFEGKDVEIEGYRPPEK